MAANGMEGHGGGWKAAEGSGIQSKTLKVLKAAEGCGRPRKAAEGRGRPRKAAEGRGKPRKAAEGRGRPRKAAEGRGRRGSRGRCVRCGRCGRCGRRPWTAEGDGARRNGAEHRGSL
eukprot:gene13058-biopygen7794